MTIFTSIATAIGTLVGASATSFFVTATAWVLKTVAGIGINLLLQKKVKKPTFSIEGSIQAGETVPRSIVMGWRGLRGSLVYANTWDDAGSTPNEMMVWVIALSDWPMQGITGIWVDGKQCTIGDVAHPDYGYPIEEYKVKKDHLWIKFYNGTQTTADSYLVNKVSSAEHPYESSRVGYGISYVIVTARIKDDLFSGFPEFLFECVGAPLYDITKDSTQGGSGTHRWNDMSTWGGDGDFLLPVQMYAVLRGLYYNSQWFYGLQNLHQSRLPASNWRAAITKARNPVDGPDGEEPEFRCSIELPVNVNINETIDTMCAAGLARISEFGGIYTIFIGAPPEPTFSIDDGVILSTTEKVFTPFKPLEDTVTGATGKYPSPEDGWNSKDAPPMYRSDLETLAGNRRLLTDVTLDLVPFPNQVQRVMRAAVLEAQRERRHTLGLPPSYWSKCIPGAVGTFTSIENGYEDKRFRVEGVQDLPDLDILVDLIEIDPSDYDYNFETDYRPVPPSNWGTKYPVEQMVPDWAINAYIEYDSELKARRATAIAEFDGDQSDVQSIRIQIRPYPDGDIIYDDLFDYGEPDEGLKFVKIPLGTLLPNEPYEGRSIFIPKSDRITNWSDWDGFVTDNVLFIDKDIADGAISITKFADGLTPVELGEGEPSNSDPANFEGRTWLDMSTGVLWTYTDGEWSHIEADVLDGSITEAKLADNAVTANKIMNDAVTSLKIANDAVSSAKIATGAVLESKLADNAVTVNKILDGAVNSGKIAAGAVLESKLAESAVTANKIAANAVTATKLLNEAVTNAKIAPLAVDAGKLANEAVTSGKLATNAVTTTKISDNAITTPKLIAGAVTASKLYITNSSNLLPDSEFADAAAWNINAGGIERGGTFQPLATNQMNSKGCIRFDPPIGSVFGDYGNFADSQHVPVSPGDSLYIEAQVNHLGTSLIRTFWTLDQYNQANTRLGGNTFGGRSDSNAGMTTHSTTYVVPAGVYSVSIRLWTNAFTSDGTPFEIGGYVIRRMNGGELIVDGAITATKVAAEAITADKIAANSITSDKVSAGAIGAIQIAAQSITADKLLIAPAVGDNLVPNPVGANGDASTWYLIEGGARTFDTSGPGYAGTSSFAITGSSGSSAYGSRAWPVVPGRTYAVRFAYRASAGSANGFYGRVAWKTDKPTVDYITQATRNGYTDLISNGPITNEWQFYQGTWTAPAGAYWANIAFYRWPGMGANSLYFTAVEFREQTTAVLIADGAITADKIAANAVIADKIAANSITVGKLVLSDNQNLLLNGDFVYGEEDWSRKIGTVSIVTGVDVPAGFSAPAAAKLVRVASEVSISQGSFSFDTDVNLKYGAPVNPGDSFYLEGMFYCDTDGVNSCINLTYRTAEGTPGGVASSVIVGSTTLVANTWTKVGIAFTAAPGFSPGRIYARVFNSLDGSTLYATRLRFMRRNTSELIVDGAVIADKIAANAVTTSKIDAGAITATQIATNAITSVKILAGAITAEKIAAAAVTADKLVANSITARELALADFSNLIPDGNLTDGKWTVSTSRGVQQRAIGQTGFKSTGDLLVYTTTAGGPGQFLAMSGLIPVNIGEEYAFYGQVEHIDATLSGHRFLISYYDASQVRNGSTALVWANDSWSAAEIREYFGSLVIPAGVRYISVDVWTHSTVQSAANVAFGGFYARRKSNANLIVDGSITAGKIAANSITSDKVAANAITTGKIAAGAITATEIATGAITSDKIEAGSIETVHLSATNFKVGSAQIDDAAITSHKVGDLEVFL